MNQTVKTEKMDIRIRVIGIAKRQRTVKVHNIDLYVDLVYADVDLNEYVTAALKKVDETMRTSEKIELYLSPWTQVKHEGYEHSMREIRFADPRYKKVTL